MDESKKKDDRAGLKVALIAIMTAITIVFTLFVRIPTGKGYFNLCDVAIYFCAFSFNPLVAFVSAGVGTALADVISGFPQWALVSFAVHGAEALTVALILKLGSKPQIKILASFCGVAIVTLGYFGLGGLLLTGFPTAVLEIPVNLLQSVIGAVLGFVVSAAVTKAYPPIKELQN